MKKLIELEYNEIIYFKKYLQTLNEKFLDKNYLDKFFEKLCLKSFDDVCKSLKYNMEPSEKIDSNNGKLEIFNSSTKIKLSPEFETTEKNFYIHCLTYLTFFKFGKLINFKNLTTKDFTKHFGLTINNQNLLEEHFEKLNEANKYFSNFQFKIIDVNIDDDLWINENDFETWLSIPISKNNDKDFNQLMLNIWCFIESF